jgi:hypothetical protein
MGPEHIGFTYGCWISLADVPGNSFDRIVLAPRLLRHVLLDELGDTGFREIQKRRNARDSYGGHSIGSWASIAEKLK